jgi:hypothetical protein
MNALTGLALAALLAASAFVRPCVLLPQHDRLTPAPKRQRKMTARFVNAATTEAEYKRRV